MTNITQTISVMEQDGPQAAERLLPLVYEELRRLAARRLAQETPGQTIQAAAFVHEAYLRLVGGDTDRRWDGRAHFFAAAAEAQANSEGEKARRSDAEAQVVLGFFQNQVLSAARPEGQDRVLGREVTIRKAVDSAEPKISEAFKDQPTVEASIRNVLGQTYGYLGGTKLELRQHHLAHDLRLSRLGANHYDTLESQNSLAVAQERSGRLDLAISLYEKMLAAMTASLGPDHPAILTTQNNLAGDYQKLDRAISLFERTLTSRVAKLGPDDPSILTTQNNLAAAYQANGERERALSLFDKTMSAREATLGPEHPDNLNSRSNLAQHSATSGQLDKAIPLYEQTLTTHIAKLGPDHASTLNTQLNLAAAHEKRGDFDKSEPLLRVMLTARKKKLGEDHLDVSQSLNSLGQNLLAQRKWAEAEPLLHEALAIRVKDGPDEWTRFNTESLLGGTLLGQQKYAEAEPFLLSGYEGLKSHESKIPAAVKIHLTRAGERVVQLYESSGREEKAAEWRARLQPPSSQPEQKP
ncbi:tetratricopeptide repeat protein (plasmid) [Tundrisphaera lichenicola]|uniref:tetratricopeptide repeat protein n=1 Tax=Tundrisphaera lichenicola TaxID=2029860 RepID=UPI003EBD2DA8